MRNVKLADGSVYPVDQCNLSFGRLQIEIVDPDETVRGLANVFGDPEKTETVLEMFDGVETPLNEYKGFTELMSVGRAGAGIYVTLRKPAKPKNTEVEQT